MSWERVTGCLIIGCLIGEALLRLGLDRWLVS